MLDRIEREVNDLDNLISSVTPSNAKSDVEPPSTSASSETVKGRGHDNLDKTPTSKESSKPSEKKEESLSSVDSMVEVKRLHSNPWTLIRHKLLTLRFRYIYNRLGALCRWQPSLDKKPVQRPHLMRMAGTRRLVTSLSRLLGTKSEVLSQLKKRLATNQLNPARVTLMSHAVNMDVGVYLDDIQGMQEKMTNERN